MICKIRVTNITYGAADALSRNPQMSSDCLAICSCIPQWVSEIIDSYTHDPFAKDLLVKLAVDASAVPHYSLQDGLLHYKRRIWVGQSAPLQDHLIAALHVSAVGGHSGFPVTYARLKQLFAWKGMKKGVKQFVSHCLICQQSKADRARLPGLLQPLSVPSSLWQVISMDFIKALPRSQSYTCILVIVDLFTKYANFLPLKHPYTALSVARLFHDQVYKHHGLPQSIVSDRDRVFLNHLWKELFRLDDVQLQMSIVYHPQSDGQSERVNQCLETFLCYFVHACPHQWSRWLSVAQFWYNSSPHSAIGMSPFQALYGCTPKQFGIADQTVIMSSELSSWLKERQLMSELVKQHLERAKLRMKRQVDKGRSEREFAVGDWVFLKLQPYVQSSVAVRAHQKLAFKFFGPFQVLQRVGTVAYKLQLPSSSRIHPVFHMSQLKHALGTGFTASVTLPTNQFHFSVPIKILQHRTVMKGLQACA
jgi:transposase InsO family protein